MARRSPSYCEGTTPLRNEAQTEALPAAFRQRRDDDARRWRNSLRLNERLAHDGESVLQHVQDGA